MDKKKNEMRIIKNNSKNENILLLAIILQIIQKIMNLSTKKLSLEPNQMIELKKRFTRRK